MITISCNFADIIKKKILLLLSSPLLLLLLLLFFGLISNILPPYGIYPRYRSSLEKALMSLNFGSLTTQFRRSIILNQYSLTPVSFSFAENTLSTATG